MAITPLGGNDDSSDIVAEINITPLTDIFLVLLIIFMITSSAMIESGGKINLPKAVATQSESRGTTVTWVNASPLPHTVTDDPARVTTASDAATPAGAQPFDSGTLGPGQSYSYTFSVPGTYQYTCLPHETIGMDGTIVVIES